MSRFAGVSSPERIAPLLLALTLTALCGLPLAALLSHGVDGVIAAMGEARVLRALQHSLSSAAASAILATLVGTVVALTLRLASLRLRGLLVFLLLLPMMIPPHVTAIAWTQALGPSGSVLSWFGLAPVAGSHNPVHTVGGLITLLALQHFPLVVVIVQSSLRSLPADLLEAARVSGASRSLTMRRIVLPLLAPSMIGAATLSFIAALGNFGINALVGVPARYTTLPVLIWQKLASFGPDVLDEVAAIATILAILALALVSLSWWWLARARQTVPNVGATIDQLNTSHRGWPTLAECLLWGFVALALGFPLLSLLTSALVPTYGVALSLDTMTFSHFTAVLLEQSVTLRAFGNSTLVASIAALCIALLAIPLAFTLTRPSGWQRRVATASVVQADLAYSVPGIVMSVAFILTFLRPLPLLNVSLYNTLALIGLAYVAVFLAVGLKPVVSASSQLDDALDDAARVSGASYLRRLTRIQAPLLAGPAVSGAILVFLTAYNEITVSALLWSSGNETIGTVIFNYEDGGYTTLAAAMSVTVILATIVMMLLLRLFARRLPSGVVPWA